MGLFGKTPERNPKDMVLDTKKGKSAFDTNCVVGKRMELQTQERRIPIGPSD